VKKYEAMFLLDAGDAAAHWDKRVDEIKGVLERHGAEIIRLVKWDDRRLAYAIRHHKRGTYILCYYEAPRETNVLVERDVQLSENVLRVIIIRREKMTVEKMLAYRVPSGEANIIGEAPPEPEPQPVTEPVAAAATEAPAAGAPDAPAVEVTETPAAETLVTPVAGAAPDAPAPAAPIADAEAEAIPETPST
jgi:small subunit ribosomal protein S6